jgi:alanyl-tRNA synthetase
MDSRTIRKTFLDFFAERGHVVRPSASVIPTDPTLLMTNAGMVPFKPYFLGEEPAPFDRATSVQKCIRTIDIDIIGTTVRHFSFFEMMGNFSFGDYFKAEAMKWAHELMVEGYGLDPDRLWYTAYEEDDEAFDLWVDHVGIDPSRVQRGGRDNFWQMGVPGPCGPSAEIFYDRGPEHGEDGGPIGGGEERFVEIWNLVFMQNIQDEPYHVIGDLPTKNIDTGLGLERLAMILQGVGSGFEIDTFRPVLEVGERFSGIEYGSDPMHDVSLRILADHGRTMSILIADGVVPSNDGRGYILRRVLRRAVRHAWRLGGEGLVTPGLAPTTIDLLGDWYTELNDKADLIIDVVTREEQNFRRTLASGHQLLEAALDGLPDAEPLSGSVAFKLHDTYGFPIELTAEIAAEKDVEVDLEKFDAEMAAQRQRARKEWKGGDAAARGEFYREVLDTAGPTEFVGYSQPTATGRILAIVREGEMIERAEHGAEVEVFVDRTPFYAESGGQIGDNGTLRTNTGEVSVSDTQHALQGLHGHRGIVASGEIRVGQAVDLVIDEPRRDRIRKSHTGTHVLHWALREVLGEHANQAGSLVESGRLRFDFSHFSATSETELQEIEALANTRLIDNGPVTTTVTSQEEAKKMGALAFFGDKYGETVRVVRVGDFSVEFCGGTHTSTAGEVGPLIVTSEASIGSNIRRIEALTGTAAYHHLTDLRESLDAVGGMLRAPAREIPDRVRGLINRIEKLEGEIDEMRAERRGELGGELAAAAEEIGGIRLVVAYVDDMAQDQLRQLALGVRDRIGEGAVFLGASPGGKGALIGAVSKGVTDTIQAGAVVAEGARVMGGGGSRDPELAQAGGPDGSKAEAAIEAIRDEARRILSKA